MLKKIMPVMALLVGLAGGATAALVLAPAEDETAERDETGGSEDLSKAPEATGDREKPDDTEIVKLPSQFVVPVILDNRVRAMVILSVALEVELGQGDTVRALEPKLRDEFLSELFNLAALDGFRDEMISRKTLELVKHALTARSVDVLGQEHVTVLITDMARQDTF